MSLDWTLFRLCNDLAGRSPWLDNTIRFLMNDYALTTALVLAAFGLWFSGSSTSAREHNQRAVLSAVASMFLGNLVVKGLNIAFYRFRPFAFNEVNVLFYYPSDSSFPSNAAFVGFAIATSVWLYNRRVGLALYVLASLLGLSRVCGGVHYPSDILGGMLIGMSVAYFIARKAAILDRMWTIVIGQMRRLLLA
jgi:undecaprenyl-diphosphatase